MPFDSAQSFERLAHNLYRKMRFSAEQKRETQTKGGKGKGGGQMS